MREALQLFKDFAANPVPVIGFLSLILAFSLLVYFKNRLAKDFESFGNKISDFEKKFSEHLSLTHAALTKHAEDFAASGRAVGEDLLKMRQSLLDLKGDLLTRLEALRDFTKNLQHESTATAHGLKMSTERFEEKFGRLVEYRAAVEAALGKIIRIDNEVTDAKSKLDKHHEWYASVAQALKRHDEELEKLRKKK